MIRTPPQHTTTHPPGQSVNPIPEALVTFREGPCPAAEKYRQTTYKGLYLRDVIKRIEDDERRLR